jgi:hypothetical protein
LVGPSSSVEVPPRTIRAPTTADVPWAPRRGTSSACASKGTCTRYKRDDLRLVLGMTRPSLGPRTRARHRHLLLRRKPVKVARASRHRGRANLRKQEEPTPGSSRTDVVRLAARHRSGNGEGVTREEKDGGRGLPPCEDRELGFGCPHVEVQLQKSVGSVRSQIGSAHALQKGRSGPSERGPSSARFLA